jgi:curved DNA-binding protein
MPGPNKEEGFIDYYELLQVSSNADSETIERVYRSLAKRYHPDNKKTGNDEKFRALVQAYRLLSDPEQRAAYDLNYEETRDRRWKAFVEASPSDGADSDKRLQQAILSLLYTARRAKASNPGVGILELETLLACPEQHMEFHIWYLKEKGWIHRTDNGMLAITATGVDAVINGNNLLRKDRLLPPGKLPTTETNSQ